jgi:hypothetical protein
MSKQSFTPGPWRQGKHPHNVVANVEGHDEIVASIGDMPCIGGHDDLAAQRGSEMEMANARLVAAAPDLLEALRAVNEDYKAALRIIAKHEGPISSAMSDMADDAIAKALGEQP